MRSLHSNGVYFRYLDGLEGDFGQHPNLASMMLAQEYPTLRIEEAKAVYCDWRHEKRTTTTGGQSFAHATEAAQPAQ